MLKTQFIRTITLAIATVASIGYAQPSRDYISIAGSSTVYPFAVAAAERFTKSTDFKPPQIQSGPSIGTSEGLKLFCAGNGIETPDIAMASRRIKSSEVEGCEKNGVKEIVEIKFGYDAIIIVHFAKNKFENLSRKELFLAMAKDVPDPEGTAKMVPNPYKNWKSINPNLPDARIQIWAPDSSHSTHDLFKSYVMLAGCKQFDSLKPLQASDPKAFENSCQNFRTDGFYSEFNEYSNAIQEIKKNPDAIGILGNYVFLKQNPNLQLSKIDGTELLLAGVITQNYPLTRPLFLYIKKAHLSLIPGLKEYLTEFTSDNAIGSSQGYLFDLGMIPMPLNERRQARDNIAKSNRLSISAGL